MRQRESRVRGVERLSSGDELGRVYSVARSIASAAIARSAGVPATSSLDVRAQPSPSRPSRPNSAPRVRLSRSLHASDRRWPTVRLAVTLGPTLRCTAKLSRLRLSIGHPSATFPIAVSPGHQAFTTHHVAPIGCRLSRVAFVRRDTIVRSLV